MRTWFADCLLVGGLLLAGLAGFTFQEIGPLAAAMLIGLAGVLIVVGSGH